MSKEVLDTLIIGAGPCGIGAAEALIKENKKIVLVEKDTPGGKVNIAPRVDNYPGFHEIPGPDLALEFYNRINNANIPFVGDDIISLTKEGDIFHAVGKVNGYYAKTVLLAVGTKERELGLPKEKELFGKGISYCAVCDGHFFKGQDVIVVGGGNTALKEAIYLSNIVNKLYVIHRRNQFRGSTKLVEELSNRNNVTILTPYVPVEIIGEDKFEGLKIRNVETNEEKILYGQGFFPLVGQIPNSQFVSFNEIKNETGNIVVDKNMATTVPGLFSGGDVLPRDIRQIYLAEHDGKVAAKNILMYLEGK